MTSRRVRPRVEISASNWKLDNSIRRQLLPSFTLLQRASAKVSEVLIYMYIYSDAIWLQVSGPFVERDGEGMRNRKIEREPEKYFEKGTGRMEDKRHLDCFGYIVFLLSLRFCCCRGAGFSISNN